MVEVECATCGRRWEKRRDNAALVTVHYCNRTCAARPVEERFWSKVNFDGPGGCWVWTAYLEKDGYGTFRCGRKHQFRAHRVAFALWHGAWPPEHTDHLCSTRACVRPAHLEATSARENVLRSKRR